MISFSSKDELKKRVNPLLLSKKDELNKQNIKCNVDDIWAYFSEVVFPNSKNLELIDIVNDIMNLDKDDFKKYMEGK